MRDLKDFIRPLAETDLEKLSFIVEPTMSETTQSRK